MKSKPSSKQFIDEIEEALSVYPQRTSKLHPETYVGGGESKLRFMGLRIPDLHEALRKGFSFSGKSSDEVARIWDHVWLNSDCFEVMALAISWFYQPQQRGVLREHWPLLKEWAGRLDNWAHSDGLSGIYARILEEKSNLVYPTLVEWNSSSYPWLRRQSIVSLLYYSSQRDRVLPFSKIMSLVKPQLNFEHYYVQKGVGWTLRETGNVYPDQTFDFIEKNIKKISSTAFSAAAEKLTQKQREHLKKLRKLKADMIERPKLGGSSQRAGPRS